MGETTQSTGARRVEEGADVRERERVVFNQFRRRNVFFSFLSAEEEEEEMEYPAGNVSMEESGSDPMVMATGNENGSEKTQNGELAHGQQQDRGKRYNHFLVCGQLFEVDAKYKPIKPIGKGAYGVVCSASNSLTSERLAIKKISNAFENVVDAKRMLREIKLLRHLQHENIIKIRDILPPPTREVFKDMYILYELMDTDLHQIIRSSQPLSDANCDLKICDFGLARTNSEKEYMTEYVVTRWYRAPELLLSCAEYTAAIDIWSVGCIFAELLGRKPLFPGKDYVHQLNLITRVLGSPDESDLEFIDSEKAKRYMRSLPQCQRVVLGKYYPHSNPLALDLIDKMLL